MPLNITFRFYDHCDETAQLIADAFSFAASAHKLAEEAPGDHVGASPDTAGQNLAQ
jgi:hypothetical protein